MSSSSDGRHRRRRRRGSGTGSPRRRRGRDDVVPVRAASSGDDSGDERRRRRKGVDEDSDDEPRRRRRKEKKKERREPTPSSDDSPRRGKRKEREKKKEKKKKQRASVSSDNSAAAASPRARKGWDKDDDGDSPRRRKKAAKAKKTKKDEVTAMSLSDSSRERHERDNARRYKERRAHAVSDAGGVTPCTDGTSRRSWQPPSSSGPQPNNSSAEWPPSGGSGLAGNAAFFGYAGSAKGTPEDAGIRRLGGGARTPPPPHLRMEAGQESSPRLGANVSPGSGVVPGGAAREAALQGMRLAMLQETIIAERKGPDDRLNIEFVTVDELVVQEVRAGAAERAGAARFVGHRLAEVNGHSVRTVDDVRAVLSLPGGLNTSLTFVPPKDVKKTRSRRPGPMQQMRADGAPLGSPRGRRTPPPAGGSAPGATPPDAPLGSGPARESSDAQRELRAAVVGHSERDGHTVYRCECCFAGRVFWVCERRLSALKALHDGVKELLGKATYRGLLGESHFPPKGGMPGTTRRLDAWLRALCGALCRPLADGEALRRLVINAVTEEIDRERILPIVLEAYDIT